MINNIKKLYFYLVAIIFTLPLITHASTLKESITGQISTSAKFLGDPGGGFAEGAQPRDVVIWVIGYIIQFILVLVGIYFFASIIYGGYMWMTAAGNDEQVGKAKKILTRAFVGFLIVLFALGFTFMIMSVVVGQTMVL